MKRVEFRDRSRRAPGGELRIFLGKARKGSKQYRELLTQKRTLEDLAKRGEWDVLQAVKRRDDYTPAEIHRLVEEHGLQHYRVGLTRRQTGPSIEETAAEYLDTIQTDSTRANYRSSYRRLMEKIDGRRTMDSLPAHEAADILTGLQKEGFAINTVAAFQATCSSLWTWWLAREASRAKHARREPISVLNPWRESEVQVRTVQTRARFLSREEYDRLIEVAAPTVRACYAISVWCGLRIDEFVHLRPQDIDLEANVVRIQPQDGWAPKGFPRYTRGVRDVPMHLDELRPHLVEYEAAYAGSARFFVNPGSGDPWSVDAWRYRVQRDVVAAGMEYGREGEGVTPHTFRHTIASWMAQADIQMAKIAAFLGDTAATVERTYAHLFPQDIDEAVNRL